MPIDSQEDMQKIRELLAQGVPLDEAIASLQYPTGGPSTFDRGYDEARARVGFGMNPTASRVMGGPPPDPVTLGQRPGVDPASQLRDIGGALNRLLKNSGLHQSGFGLNMVGRDINRGMSDKIDASSLPTGMSAPGDDLRSAGGALNRFFKRTPNEGMANLDPGATIQDLDPRDAMILLDWFRKKGMRGNTGEMTPEVEVALRRLKENVGTAGKMATTGGMGWGMEEEREIPPGALEREGKPEGPDFAGILKGHEADTDKWRKGQPSRPEVGLDAGGDNIAGVGQKEMIGPIEGDLDTFADEAMAAMPEQEGPGLGARILRGAGKTSGKSLLMLLAGALGGEGMRKGLETGIKREREDERFDKGMTFREKQMAQMKEMAEAQMTQRREIEGQRIALMKQKLGVDVYEAMMSQDKAAQTLGSKLDKEKREVFQKETEVLRTMRTIQIATIANARFSTLHAALRPLFEGKDVKAGSRQIAALTAFQKMIDDAVVRSDDVNLQKMAQSWGEQFSAYIGGIKHGDVFNMSLMRSMYDTGIDFITALNETGQKQINAHVGSLPPDFYSEDVITGLSEYGNKMLIIPDMPDYSPEAQLRRIEEEEEALRAEDGTETATGYNSLLQEYMGFDDDQRPSDLRPYKSYPLGEETKKERAWIDSRIGRKNFGGGGSE